MEINSRASGARTCCNFHIRRESVWSGASTCPHKVLRTRLCQQTSANENNSLQMRSILWWRHKVISSALRSLCTESKIRRHRWFHIAISTLAHLFFSQTATTVGGSWLGGRKIANRIHFKKNNISRPNIMLTVIEYIMRANEIRTNPSPDISVSDGCLEQYVKYAESCCHTSKRQHRKAPTE